MEKNILTKIEIWNYKYLILYYIILLLICINVFSQNSKYSNTNDQNYENSIINIATTQLRKYKINNKNIVTIINFNKGINDERLYVVDINKRKIILKTTVSHAFKTGSFKSLLINAENFSNTIDSKKSSIGAYLTKDTYYGKYGYSLNLKGLDSTNSNAEKRRIIFHSNKLMKTKWSWGCFATPDKINIKLINIIKNGTLVYVYK